MSNNLSWHCTSTIAAFVFPLDIPFYPVQQNFYSPVTDLRVVSTRNKVMIQALGNIFANSKTNMEGTRVPISTREDGPSPSRKGKKRVYGDQRTESGLNTVEGEDPLK